MNRLEKEGGTMCQAITELIEDGRIEGRQEGRESEKIEAFINCIRMDISEDKAKVITNISDELMKKAYEQMDYVV